MLKEKQTALIKLKIKMIYLNFRRVGEDFHKNFLALLSSSEVEDMD